MDANDGGGDDDGDDEMMQLLMEQLRKAHTLRTLNRVVADSLFQIHLHCSRVPMNQDPLKLLQHQELRIWQRLQITNHHVFHDVS